MNGPEVSVVIPAYAEPAYLAKALASVRAQSFENFEVLVIDDGSPVPLEDAFREGAAGDARFRLLKQANAGGSAARNRGVAESRGDWVAFLDHDDLWLPEKLERSLSCARDGGGAPRLLFCQFREFGGSGEDSPPFPEWEGVRDIGLRDLLERTCIRTLSVVLVERAALGRGSCFRTDLAVANDIELYYRLARVGSLRYLPEALVRKRRHERNVTADPVPMHVEAARISEELLAGLQDAESRELAELARRRALRHRLGAASAARRAGDRAMAIAQARHALRHDPRSLRAWRTRLLARLGL